MIKQFLFCFIFVAVSEPLRAAPFLQTIPPNKNITDERLIADPNWQASALMVFTNDRDSIEPRSGFFVGSRSFLTVVSPSKGISELRCDKLTIVQGLVVPVGNTFEGGKDAKQLKCESILPVRYNPSLVIIRTVEESPYFLGFHNDVRFWSRPKPLSVLGHSYEGRRMIADSCQALKPGCNICSSVKVGGSGWQEIQCSIRSGMPGSPVMIWNGKNWEVTGIVSTVMARHGDEFNSGAAAIVTLSDKVRLDGAGQ